MRIAPEPIRQGVRVEGGVEGGREPRGIPPTMPVPVIRNPILGSFKDGGKVQKTGNYKLHKGETVVAKKEEESKGAKKVLGGKSGKKHVHKMHIRRSANKGYIAEHEPLPGEQSEPPEANEEHVLPDMDALKAHVEQHMQPEEEAAPQEAPPAQAMPA